LSHLVPGGYKHGNFALQVGRVSKIGKIEYGFESRGTQTPRGTALARSSSNSKLQTRPLVRESAIKIINPQQCKENFKEKEKLVTDPKCGLTPGQAGRLAVGRKIILT
jgi:hypothetical protein